jgi:NADH-quinone oxidoreductase subunit K
MQLPSSALSFLAQGETVAATSGIGLSHYLVVSALAFCLGLTIVIVRRNAIAVLMGIELLINAAGLNFVAFAKFLIKDPVDGQLVTLFIIVMAAAEAALALAIVLNIFSNTNTIDVSEADALKG